MCATNSPLHSFLAMLIPNVQTRADKHSVTDESPNRGMGMSALPRQGKKAGVNAPSAASSESQEGRNLHLLRGLEGPGSMAGGETSAEGRETPVAESPEVPRVAIVDSSFSSPYIACSTLFIAVGQKGRHSNN